MYKQKSSNQITIKIQSAQFQSGLLRIYLICSALSAPLDVDK